MRAKLATPVALAAAAGVFIGLFLITRSFLWSLVLGFGASVGLYLMLDSRTKVQVEDSDYAEDASDKADDALKVTRQIKSLINQVQSPSVRGSLQQACEVVPELLARVKKTSPTSLYSSAAALNGHVSSLLGVVQQYLDIQAKPNFYNDPVTLMRNGEEAISRFTQFAIESVRLVNSGDVAQYQANLQTVAPPQLPTL